MAKLGNTIERHMFYGASPLIFERAKALRSCPTLAEKNLWKFLKNNNLSGLKFRRQHPIARFIADFYCHQIKLVIELDGDSHMSEKAKEYDEGRTVEFERLGIREIRFTNQQVFNDPVNVKITIEKVCKEMMQVF